MNSGFWACLFWTVILWFYSVGSQSLNPFNDSSISLFGSIIGYFLILYLLYRVILHFYEPSDYWGVLMWIAALLGIFLLLCIILGIFLFGLMWITGYSPSPLKDSPNLTGKLSSFNKYGFTFSYPADDSIIEIGIDDSPNTMDTGGVHIDAYDEDGYVYWTKQPAPPMDPPQLSKDQLMFLSVSYKQEGGGLLNFSNPLFFKGHYHALTYYPIKTSYRTTIYGGLVIWYCPETSHLFKFILFTEKDPTFTKDRIMQYISRFHCHSSQ